MTITITDLAADKIKEMMDQAERHVLALGVQQSGCGCQHLAAELIQNSVPEDQISEFNGIQVYVDPNSGERLEGTELDYVVTEQGEGFTIVAPNLDKACGCG